MRAVSHDMTGLAALEASASSALVVTKPIIHVSDRGPRNRSSTRLRSGFCSSLELHLLLWGARCWRDNREDAIAIGEHERLSTSDNSARVGDSCGEAHPFLCDNAHRVNGCREPHACNAIVLERGQHGAVSLLLELLEEPYGLLLLIHVGRAAGFPTSHQCVELLFKNI
jgi:hypothetical protein